MDIPKPIRDEYLPNPLVSIISLLEHPPPNITPDSPATPVNSMLSTLPSYFENCDASRIALTISSLTVPPVTFVQAMCNLIATNKEYQSFAYDCNGSQILLPFWVVNLWMEQHSVAQAQVTWTRAVAWVNRLSTAQEWMSVLTRIPWKYNLPRSLGGSIGIQFLAGFCSKDWLSSLHIDQMTAVLDWQLLTDAPGKRSVGTVWSDTLRSIYQCGRNEYSSSSSAQYLRHLGAEIAGGQIHHLATIVSVYLGGDHSAVLPHQGQPRGNHWTAVVLDLDQGVVRYGDPAGFEAPNDLLAMIVWWLEQHGWDKDMKIESLPCPSQGDSHSCSTLAFNSIVSYIYPTIPLVSSSPDGVPGRLQALELISIYVQDLITGACSQQHKGDAALIKNEASMVSETKQPPPKKDTANQFIKRWPGYSLDEQIGVIFKRVVPLSSKRGNSTLDTSARKPKRMRRGRDNDVGEEMDENEGESFDILLEDDAEEQLEEEPAQNPLIDCPEEKGRDLQRGGRPCSDILDQLTVRCYRASDPEVIVWRCSGKGCTHTVSKRGKDRVFKHARVCTKLAPGLQEKVRVQSAQRAPSLKVETLAKGAERGKKEKDVKKTGVTDKEPARPNGAVHQGSVDFFNRAKELGKAQRHKQITLAITELFCVCGLPLSLASSSAWRKVLAYADPSYKPPDRFALSDKWIPGEADRIYINTVEELKAHNDLTLSLDGGTSHSRESFWTLHVSTPLSQVYLLQVREATAESHTGDWLRDFAMQTIEGIGPARFSCMVSDSTGNTLLGQTKVARAVPTIIPVADCVHYISNTIGDIVKLSFFRQTLTIVRAVITKIHKSHLGTAELKAARSVVPGAPGRGLEAVGKTRFGTVIYSARSLERNLPVLKEIVRRKKFNMGAYAQYFDTKANFITHEFEFALAKIVRIGTPAIQAMTCLESNMATAADVYVFFHAFLALTLKTLEEKGMAFENEEKDQIRSILEWRYNQLFGTGNLASDIYVSAAYLIPVHVTSALFKCEPALNDHPDFAGIHNLAVFKRVANFLISTAEKEINHGHKPELTIWRNRASVFISKLLNELKAYSRQQYPFNSPYDEDTGPLLWWSALCKNELSQVLPILAIKILSVRVNSMEEERTGSVFTWLSPPLRSRISIDMMGAITRVRRHFKEESKLNSPSLRRPKLHFYEFRNRFMDDTQKGENQASSDTGEPGEKEKFSEVVINGADADEADDEDDWLTHNTDTAKVHSASGSIEASPVALDSTHVAAALSWNAPSRVPPDTSSTLSLALEVIASGDDNDFSISLDF
ncbi:hypothetical protein Agabi119p4_7887 [Agaricus bisporus var. burnettii]|uniref:Ubiquitin-like protease family profile domain-containing protein n=1 Tax=Agaricus bisporus var. burnettii TaxID=192524 RepID=A0A8H7CAF3_AGABI|nr:hypothetical protein Agabi119p4_7887 [Agaricus bisporus var. burnettii]